VPPGRFDARRYVLSEVTVTERFAVVGVGLMEYEPARDEDRDLLSGLVARLAEVCARR
jgi:hypothetical protein